MNANERKQIIDARKNPAQRDGKNRAWPIFCNGQWREMPVWRVPIEALVLNVDNKRFAALKTWAEAELDHPLDPENNPKDDKSIISILLDKNLRIHDDTIMGSPSKDYEALREDWTTRQQAEPLWIRPDGTVRNGNRRLAMLRRLHDHGSSPTGQWVDAIVLSYEDVDELELFRMEQGDQLTENFKVRYGKIDALLALKEAAEQEGIVWADSDSLNDVALKLKHIAGRDDRRYAATQLRAIRAIDAYLDYLGQPKQYHLVMQERQVEVFREVGRILELGDEYPDELDDLAGLSFAAVQIGLRYEGIRSLRKLFQDDKEAFVDLAGQVGEVEKQAGWPPADSGTDDGEIESAGVDVLTAEDDEEGADAPAPVSVTYPQNDVRPLIDRAVDTINVSSLGLLNSLQQAATRLLTITDADLASALSGPQQVYVAEALATVVEWAEAHRDSVTDAE